MVANCTTYTICRNILGARSTSKRSASYCWGGRRCASCMSLHAALATYTPHVRVCAGTNTRIKVDEGGGESACFNDAGGAKLKPSAESFGCCALTTQTEYRIEGDTPPLEVCIPSAGAEVGPKRCASVPASTRSDLRKNIKCPPSSRKMFILLNGNTTAEPPDIKFRKPFADHAT